jgi:hypothetical protein
MNFKSLIVKIAFTYIALFGMANVSANEIKIVLELPKLDVDPYHKPYIAIWIETPDRKAINTIALWVEKDTWFKDLRQWWRKIGRANASSLDGPKTKYLKATGVRENRPLPLGKVMEITVGFNHLSAWAQHQMKGIAENNLSTDINYILGQHAFNRAVGTHRHKGRGLHLAPRKSHFTTPRLAVRRRHSKVHKALALGLNVNLRVRLGIRSGTHSGIVSGARGL